MKPVVMSLWMLVCFILSTHAFTYERSNSYNDNGSEQEKRLTRVLADLINVLKKETEVDQADTDQKSDVAIAPERGLNVERAQTFHWGYAPSNGPAVWSTYFPAGKGTSQSPIDIKSKHAVYQKYGPLKWSYVPSNAKELLNNGHTAEVTYLGTGSSLTGGPLNYKYQLAQFHFHWGKDDHSGSEHLIDEEQFPLELHMVHWNSQSYSTIAQAAQVRGGLCVLSILLKVGDKEHEELKKVTDQLSKISYQGDLVPLTHGIDPTKILPEKAEYWTYLGSLTTPPLYESATWIVFKEHVKISEDQLKAFRTLHNFQKGGVPGGYISGNFRPTQPLGSRMVYTNIQSDNKHHSREEGDWESSLEERSSVGKRNWATY